MLLVRSGLRWAPADLVPVEQSRLQVGRRLARDGAVAAVVDAVDEPGIALSEYGAGLVAAAGEALLLPDLVETAGVAAIARHQLLASHPQPARDPDVDGVGFPERTPAHWRGNNGFWRLRVHDATLTESEHRPLCAGKDSKVMAASAPRR